MLQCTQGHILGISYAQGRIENIHAEYQGKTTA